MLSGKSISRIRQLLNEESDVETEKIESELDKDLEECDLEKKEKELKKEEKVETPEVVKDKADVREEEEKDEEEKAEDKEEVKEEDSPMTAQLDAEIKKLGEEDEEEEKEKEELNKAAEEEAVDPELKDEEEVVEAEDKEEEEVPTEEVPADDVEIEADAEVPADDASEDEQDSLDDIEKEFDINDDSDVFLNDDEEAEAFREKEKEEKVEECDKDLVDPAAEVKEEEESEEEKKEEEEEKAEKEVKEEEVAKTPEVVKDKADVREEEEKDEESEEEEEKELKKEEKKPDMDIEEHMSALFNGETLSEDFQKKARVIFEAAVRDKVLQFAKTLKTRYNKRLVAARSRIQENMVNKVDTYLDYIVEQWMQQNKLAVTHGLRQEVTEEFITDLRALFEAHNIMIPEGKENLVESLADQVEKLKGQLEEATKKDEANKKQISEFKKESEFKKLCEGLADTEIERLKSMTKAIEYNESYREKVKTIKESYFSKKAKTVTAGIEELVETKKESEIKEVPAGEAPDTLVQAATRVAKRIR